MGDEIARAVWDICQKLVQETASGMFMCVKLTTGDLDELVEDVVGGNSAEAMEWIEQIAMLAYGRKDEPRTPEEMDQLFATVVEWAYKALKESGKITGE